MRRAGKPGSRSNVKKPAGLRDYAALFDFAPCGYLVLDASGAILQVNRECARMLGVRRKTLQNARFAHHIDERRRTAFATFLEDVFAAAGDPLQREVTLCPAGGEPLLVRLLGASIASARGSRALVAIQDVTALRRTEATLREELTRRDSFLATLSHEVRNPLAPIRSSLTLLDRAQPGSEAEKALVQRATEDYRPTFDARGIALDYQAGANELPVDADATRLVQVIGNLLGNSIKFTPLGGRVEVRLRREGGQAVLGVHDSGIGIEPEVRTRIFQPFMQAPHSIDSAQGGLGLGLSIVKSLVELHGGTVDVASEGLGRGTTFTVRLPLVPCL